MAVPDLLRRLLTSPGPSGAESAPVGAWREVASAFAAVSVDALGSAVARVPGTAGGPVLAIYGHVDEIGLIVTHVDEQGFLFFRDLGGWLPEVLVGQRVELLTRDGPVPGVVLARRDRKRMEDKKSPELRDLHIDVGARDRNEAAKLVRLGDTAVLAAEPLELPNGRLASRSLDNRLGAYVALEAARRLAEDGGGPGDVAAVASVQEEVGDFAGARVTTFALEPEVAIVVDVTPATDVPGGDPKEVGEQKLGAGPLVQRGPTVAPRVHEVLVETAEAEGIPFAVDVTHGRSHTDADAVHLTLRGVPTGVVSVPTRYLHTPVEICQLDDVEACVRLVVAFARRLQPGMSFLP